MSKEKNVEKTETTRDLYNVSDFRVKFKNGKVHVFKLPTIEQLIKYEQRLSGDLEVDTKAKVRTIAGTPNTAKIKLYNDCLDRVDGLPAGEIIQPSHKIAAIKKMGDNFVVSREEVQDAFGQEYLIQEKPGVCYLQSFYLNNNFVTTHVLAPPSDDDFFEFERLTSVVRSQQKKGFRSISVLSSNAETPGKIALYDKLFIEAHGYTDNNVTKIPNLHKLAVIQELMKEASEETEEIAGN
jgi:hypothetical protein